MRVKIRLKIYEFYLFLGFKAIHTEVCVYGRDIWYTNDKGICWCFEQNKEDNARYSYRLKEIVDAGLCLKTIHQVQNILLCLQQKYNPQTYCIFSNNCRNFSLDFLEKIQPTKREIGILTTYLNNILIS